MKVGEFVTGTLCFIGCLLVCASSTKFTVSTHDTVYSCTKQSADAVRLERTQPAYYDYDIFDNQ